MGNISTWKDTADANGTAGSPPDYWPEGQSPSSVNNCARELMRAIRVQWQDAAWFDFGLTVSLKSQNKIKITSSSYTATDIFLTNRRVKVISNSVTIYGDVSTVSSSGSAELVTIVCDSGTLTTNVTQVSVGIIEPTNSPIPGGGASSIFIEQDGSQIFAADAAASDTYVIALDPAITAYVTGMMINFSANTLNTGAATLNVDGLGAKAILKRNNRALETGDIEAGQIITAIYDGTSFQMQSQQAVVQSADLASGVGGSWILLSTQTASTSASLDFSTGISSTYSNYIFILQNVAPVTDGVRLHVRTSTDGGSTYDSGSGNYTFIITGYENGLVTNSNSGLLGTTFIALDSVTIGNATGETINGQVLLTNPSAATYTQLSWGVGGHSTAVDANFWQNGHGRRASAADVDAVQFLMSSGSILSGVIKLYGVI